ncbi:asparagine--tRNA ligase [Candidatus Phytoplasma pini]|uniref:Asparagine--tRNA ligase n=1 Tax=Candidatus Phytoplasma pini TaxID=267362 RepID=A0A559KJZ4_9MOLU|nr:asparagine--tRNA ligase [Candidatus Phytoplasma pini]TVY12454.1 Asparaginyl-tRNA synthetase [Candidatus Phytoplasma pini]
MFKRVKSIKELYDKYVIYLNQSILIEGWLKNRRCQKKMVFLDLNDGTSLDDLQIVYRIDDFNNIVNEIKNNLQIGISLQIKGYLVKSKTEEQKIEILAKEIIILGKNYSDYPIQTKKHSKAFLRQNAHLRLRTKLFGAIFRIRSTVYYAVNDFFRKEAFFNIATPIITTSDGEGAGELFKVTSFDLEKIPFDQNKKVDYKKDFFGQKTFLTVTGQLEAEAFATSLRKVYTFGPVFRAENSNTPRHISEFWMIEVEEAFCDLQKIINLAQKLLQQIIKYCLKNNIEDFLFLEKNGEFNLISRLEKIAFLEKIKQIDYKEAIKILINNQDLFENKPFFGSDLFNEHEKFLTEIYFQEPIFIINWPRNIKAFYMKDNSDHQTVAAMDLLVPKVGELIGGSQREEKLEVLINKMKEFNIAYEELEWYLDLRRFGSCIHSGFGVGFERLLIFLTGLDNVKDVIAFPRTPGNAFF